MRYLLARRGWVTRVLIFCKVESFDTKQVLKCSGNMTGSKTLHDFKLFKESPKGERFGAWGIYQHILSSPPGVFCQVFFGVFFFFFSGWLKVCFGCCVCFFGCSTWLHSFKRLAANFPSKISGWESSLSCFWSSIFSGLAAVWGAWGRKPPPQITILRNVNHMWYMWNHFILDVFREGDF